MGMTVVHLGRELHFTPVEMVGTYKANSRYPLSLPGILPAFEARLDRSNFLWMAMRGNIARQVCNVLPHDDFLQKLALVKEAQGGGYLGVLELTDKTIVAHELGSKRVITDSFLPETGEPVLLNVDASILSLFEPAELYRMLDTSGLRYIYIACCLSKDNPAVSESERKRMREFVRLLAERRIN